LLQRRRPTEVRAKITSLAIFAYLMYFAYLIFLLILIALLLLVLS